MWNFMMPSGLSTTIIDFTNDFSLLGLGLIGLTALAAGSIAGMALRHYIAQRAARGIEPVSTDVRKAA
ncbi:MAG: hypothetical protein AB1671_03060 [Thermodesulfobacteriota bacterium]|jgi:hypothetical protein